MANRKISELIALTAPATGDLLPIVDISEAVAADKNKKITYGELLASAPAGSAAAPSFSFDGDPNSGVYSAGADQVAIATGGTERLTTSTTAVTSTLSIAHPLGAVGTPSITFTGDLNTGIYSPGADQVAITTGGTGRLFIDSSGRLLAGTSTARSNFFGTTLSSVVQVEGTGGGAGRGALSVINDDVSNNPPYVLLGRSGAATLGSNTAVVSGSRLGTLTFHGADGTSFIEAATVAGEVDGTPGANDMPGRLVFSTTADGAASPTEKLRITSAGLVGIGTSSPAQTLHVNGSGTQYLQVSSTSNDATTLLGATNSGTFLINQSTTLPTQIWTNGSPRIHISSAGNVGIGTTSPGTTLDVFGTIRASAAATQDGVTLQGRAGGTSSYKSILTPTTLTADRTLTLPNTTGTLITTGDTGTVTSTMILDGTILDADINSAAAIAGTKISPNFGSQNTVTTGTNTAASFVPTSSVAPALGVYSPATNTFGISTNSAERVRVTVEGTYCYNQAAGPTYTTAQTLTAAEIKGGLVTANISASTTFTVPTGTDLDSSFSSPYTNMTFQWTLLNTGTALASLAANTGHTLTGTLSTASDNGRKFATRRTGTNTYVSFRVG